MNNDDNNNTDNKNNTHNYYNHDMITTRTRTKAIVKVIKPTLAVIA